jgi:hypothetical protein
MSPLRHLRDEAGQSVVLFVLIMSGFFAIIAFLINVGAVFQEGHRLQGVAESASLAGAQDDVSVLGTAGVGNESRRDFFAGYDAVKGPSGYLPLHAPGVDLTAGKCSSGFCSDVRDSGGSGKPTTEVDVSKDVNLYFSDLFALLGASSLTNITLRASSIASTQAPTKLDNIAPLALECDFECQNDAQKASGTWHWPLDGSSYCFRFQPNDVSAGQDPTAGCDVHGSGVAVPHFAPIALPGSSLTNLGCAPLSGLANCNSTEIDLDSNPDQPRDPLLLKTDFRRAVENAEGTDVRIVPVYDDFTPDPSAPSYHLIGWAAVSWTVRPFTEPNFEIDVSFHKLFVDSTRLTDPGIPAAPYDFGVEAVGLTGCKSIPDGCGG